MATQSIQPASKEEVIERYQECAIKFNKCHNLLTETTKELDAAKKSLKKAEKIITEVQKDLSKEIWLPFNFAFGGFVSPPYDYGLYISFQFLSLRPVKITFVEDLGLHLNGGPNSATASLSYSLQELHMYNSKLHLLYGANFKLFKTQSVGSFVGFGFSLNF